VTFYLDENLSPHVAEILRARGFDVVSAHAVGNTQLDDGAQLHYATSERGAIVTCDLTDFTELAGEFIAANIEHAGIVLVPSTVETDEFSAIADALEQVAHEHPEGLAGVILYLSRAPR
jgi:predicted nuclease of predicted toxin-antitoxin system